MTLPAPSRAVAPASAIEDDAAIIRYIRGVEAETRAPVRARRLYAWLELTFGITRPAAGARLRALRRSGRLEMVDEDGNVIPPTAGSGVVVRNRFELYYRVPA